MLAVTARYSPALRSVSVASIFPWWYGPCSLSSVRGITTYLDETTVSSSSQMMAFSASKPRAGALGVGARSYRHVESILKHGLDRIAPTDVAPAQRATHENIRGRDYYH